jgi:hypothetical protein
MLPIKKNVVTMVKGQSPIEIKWDDALFRYHFSAYLRKTEEFKYRCVDRECNYQILIKKDQFDDSIIESHTENYKLKSNAVEWKPHNVDENKKHSCLAVKKVQSNISDVSTFGSDPEVLRDFIAKNLLSHPTKLRTELIKQKQNFTVNQIKNELYASREAIYPTDLFLVMTPEYCRSEDASDSGQNIFRGYFKIPMVRKNGNYSQVAILGSQFQLQLLAEAENWYIDGTFYACPPGFYQLLNIMIYQKQIPICVCHILMSSKLEVEYFFALSNLITIIKLLGFNPNPKVIMCDFEEGLRNALKMLFPKAEINGCYFHFVKNLWKKASDLGLRKKPSVTMTGVIIALFCILIHIPRQFRGSYFSYIRKICKNEGEYEDLLNYMEKNWIKEELFSLDTKDIHRTNNICESFHSTLSKIF